MNSVSIITFDESTLNNKIFSDQVRDNCNLHWRELRFKCKVENIELNTCDFRGNDKSVVNIYLGFSRKHLQYYFTHKHKPQKSILLVREPRLIQEFLWKYLWLIQHLFSTVFIWDTDYLKKSRFNYLPIPFYKEDINAYTSEKTEFAILICGAKKSAKPMELYSKRIEIVRNFHNHRKGSIHLFGFGWDTAAEIADIRDEVYRGQADEKISTISRYKFCFCLENSINKNYLSEKIFDALLAGSVPVYLGDPHITKKIPKECFIDIRNFNNLDDLYRYMYKLPDEEYIKYLESGSSFIKSENFSVFKSNYFANVIYDAIHKRLEY